MYAQGFEIIFLGNFQCPSNYIAWGIYSVHSAWTVYIFHYWIQRNPDCFLKNRPCSHCVAVGNNENNQSDDILLVEQCHPQGNEALRDPALIRSAEFFCFCFYNLALDLIHINCPGYQHHGYKMYLHHPYKRKFLLLSCRM